MFIVWEVTDSGYRPNATNEVRSVYDIVLGITNSTEKADKALRAACDMTFGNVYIELHSFKVECIDADVVEWQRQYDKNWLKHQIRQAFDEEFAEIDALQKEEDENDLTHDVRKGLFKAELKSFRLKLSQKGII